MDLNANFEFTSSQSMAISFDEEVLNPRSHVIHENALNRAKKYLIAESALLAAIIEVDSDKTFEKFGLTHLTPYCVKHLGLSEDVAACFVRVARKSRQVPELKDAIDEGRISVTKAKTIASVITPENQNGWIAKAETLSKEKLEQAVAANSPQSKKPEKAKPTGPNRVRVEFELSETEMALFRRAQELLYQKGGKSVSLAEVQAELLSVFLDKHDPLRKAQRAKDKKLDRSRDHSSFPRQKQRSKIPAAIAHEVHLRDQGICQAELPDGSRCGEKKWVHLHHLRPLSEGGGHAAENLLTLCSGHHRLWHTRAELRACEGIRMNQSN